MGRFLLANAGTSSLISAVLTFVMVVPAAGNSSANTSAQTTNGPFCVVILADADPTDVGGEALIAEERCFTTWKSVV